MKDDYIEDEDFWTEVEQLEEKNKTKVGRTGQNRGWKYEKEDYNQKHRYLGV